MKAGGVHFFPQQLPLTKIAGKLSEDNERVGKTGVTISESENCRRSESGMNIAGIRSKEKLLEYTFLTPHPQL